MPDDFFCARLVAVRLTLPADRLLGFDATATGKGYVYGDGKTAQYYVDGLEKPGNLLTWQVRVDEPQRYAVEVKYSTPKPAQTGGKFVVKIGGTTLTAPIEATSSARQRWRRLPPHVEREPSSKTG